MEDKNKKIWDEVLGGIDEKYIAETAELLSGCKEEDHSVSEKGIELKPRHEKSGGKKLRPWLFSAAAVLVAGVVGATAWIGVSLRNELAAQDSSSNSGVTLCKSDADNAAIDYSDRYLYSIDYDIFEEYFIGEWEPSNGGSTLHYSYIGESTELGFYGGLYSVYKKNDGYYMMGTTDGKGTVYFIPSDDTEHMYYYDDVDGVVDKDFYFDVYKRVSDGTDADREISVGNYMSCAALRKLDDEYGGILTTAFSDIEGSVLNDNEGCEWTMVFFADDNYEAPRLISLDSGQITLAFPFSRADDPSVLRSIYLNVVISDGSWYWRATDEDGRVYFTGSNDTSFSKELDIYERLFMGEWADENYPEKSFVLSYKEDFLEKGISSFSGYGNYGDCYVFSVEVSGASESGILPAFDKGELLYAVYTDDTEHMYCYTGGDIYGEPYAVYKKTGEVTAELPERGEVSQLGMHKLMNELGGDMPILFLAAEKEVEYDGVTYTDGGAPYYILSRSSSSVTIMMDYTDGETGGDCSVTVSFADDGSSWRMTDVQRAVNMTDDGIRIGQTEEGYYYLTTEQLDAGTLTHVYYYSNESGVMFELNAEGNPDYRLCNADYCSDGNRLYVLGDNIGGNGGAQVALAVYADGRRLMSQVLSETTNGYTYSSITLSEGYIRAEWNDAERKYALIDPMDFSGGVILTADREEMVDAFLSETDTNLPLIMYRLNELNTILSGDTSALLNDIAAADSVLIDGKTYYKTDCPLFDSYDEFADFVRTIYTDECAEKVLNSASIKEHGGSLYAAYPQDNGVQHYDSYEVSGYGENYMDVAFMRSDGSAETLRLENIVSGWRLTDAN